jgi:hypothetical protein
MDVEAELDRKNHGRSDRTQSNDVEWTTPTKKLMDLGKTRGRQVVMGKKTSENLEDIADKQ